MNRNTLAAIRLFLLLIAASQLACNLPVLNQGRVPEFINHPSTTTAFAPRAALDNNIGIEVT